MVQSDNATEPVAGHARPDVLDEVVAEVLRAEPAAGTGRTLRNLAPKSRSVAERYIENHRKHRSLARNWPAPPRIGRPYPEPRAGPRGGRPGS